MIIQKQDMVQLKQKILEYVRQNGPVLPVDITKHVGVNLIFSSALLSELVSDKKIFLTYGKIGSSPLYYAQGQEQKLSRLYDYLGGVEKEAYNLVKEEGILKDDELPPKIRVAMRDIKDFAHPIDVKLGEDNIERFWKWYLVSTTAAQDRIASYYDKVNQINREEQKSEIKKNSSDELETEIKPELVKVEPKTPETQKRLTEKKPEIKEIKERRVNKPVDYRENVLVYFDENEIEILDENIVRKNSEMDFYILVPSAVGKIKFFVKVRNKKKISKGDISLAYQTSSKENLPCLFITSGETTNKTLEFVQKSFEGLIFKQIKN